jgi:hypothetical protein
MLTICDAISSFSAFRRSRGTTSVRLQQLDSPRFEFVPLPDPFLTEGPGLDCEDLKVREQRVLEVGPQFLRDGDHPVQLTTSSSTTLISTTD